MAPSTICTIVGARPQFIKAAMVSRALRTVAAVREVLVHTDQHYDRNLSQVFFDEMEIPAPDYRLGIGSSSHGAQTGRMLEAIETALVEIEPQLVVVYGDTNTTLAGALAAAKLNLPIAHVEAGLRSHNRSMPEEVNRVVADHVARILLAPTAQAVRNLRQEGISEDWIHETGDVMFDAALAFGEVAREKSDILTRAGVEAGTYVLATVHRAENTDHISRFTSILEGLAAVAGEVPIVFPLHPRTKKAIVDYGMEALLDSLQEMAPVGYLDMLALEKHARLIVTDSGGVQKEAFFQNVPCLTLRDETEWTELVDLGCNRLVSAASSSGVAEAILSALKDPPSWQVQADLYGGGQASQRIVRVLFDFLAALET